MKNQILFFLSGIVFGVALAQAEPTGARFTQLIKDVTLVNESSRHHAPASRDEIIPAGSVIQTGKASRAEVTLADQTLARLGANTTFSCGSGSRNLELLDGAMLVRAPARARGAEVEVAGVQADVAGTTSMLDFHPGAYFKFIVVEGTGRVFKSGHVGESVLVRAGQMLIMKPGDPLPDPVDIDIERLAATSIFFSKDFSPLSSTPLISGEIDSQHHEKAKGKLIDTNLVIFGTGTSVSIVNPTPAAQPASIAKSKTAANPRGASAAPSATPAPPESQPL